MRRPGAEVWLAAAVVLPLLAVAAAWVTQYRWDMQPCPWCVLQRAIFLAISLVALLAWLLRARLARRIACAAGMLLAAAGMAAALWQHFVAAASASCNLTLADRIMSALGLDAAWPDMFAARASCADAAVNLAGVPYEFWSLALFAVLDLMLVRVLLNPGTDP